MTQRNKPEDDSRKMVQQRITSLKRQDQLQSWLNGEGELTEEEKKLTSRIGGENAPMYIREIVSRHRQGKLAETLEGGNGPQTTEEDELVSRFGGESAELYQKMALGLNRKSKLFGWLTDDDSSDGK